MIVNTVDCLHKKKLAFKTTTLIKGAHFVPFPFFKTP